MLLVPSRAETMRMIIAMSSSSMNKTMAHGVFLIATLALHGVKRCVSPSSHNDGAVGAQPR